MTKTIMKNPRLLSRSYKLNKGSHCIKPSHYTEYRFNYRCIRRSYSFRPVIYFKSLKLCDYGDIDYGV